MHAASVVACIPGGYQATGAQRGLLELILTSQQAYVEDGAQDCFASTYYIQYIHIMLHASNIAGGAVKPGGRLRLVATSY